MVERALSHLQKTTDSLVQHFVAAATIEAKRAEYAALSADSPAGYESVRVAIAHCRTTRVGIEKKRKELKADSLKYGRQVDRVAWELTSLIEDLEAPLKAKKAVIDDEKTRAKLEAEAARKRAIEETIRAEREAEEARQREEREAEEARLRAEREAEEERLREEREKFAEERRIAQEAQRVERERLEAEEARLRAEREKIEAARREVEAAREKASREEFERQAKILAEEEARTWAEAERIAAEEARVAEAERKARAAERLEALRSDQEKVAGFANAILAIMPPEVSDPEVGRLLVDARDTLNEIVGELVEKVDALHEKEKTDD